MALDIGELTGTLSINAHDWDLGIAGAKADLARLGKEGASEAAAAGTEVGHSYGSAMLTKAKSFVGMVGGALMKGVKYVGVTAGAVLATALFKGWGRLTDIENATAKLTGLGHSAAEVKTIMGNALSSVKGTAFGLDEAATIAAGTVAAGVQPGKDLTRTLGLVGDAATISGQSMGEMGAIFNKVAASNKIQGDVIAQLNDAGIPIIQLLGKTMHKTSAQVTDLASKGKIDFKTFQTAMETGLGGAALKSGDTTVGAFKNMGAALSRFGVSLLSGVFPVAKLVFGGITGWLDRIGPSVTAFGVEVSGGLTALVAAFQAGGSDITSSGFAGVMERIGLAARVIWDWIANTAIPSVRNFVTEFQDGTGAGGAFRDILTNIWNNALVPLANFITSTVIPAFVAIGVAIAGVAIFFVQHQNAAIALGVVVSGVLAVVTAAWVAQGVVAVINSVKSVLAWLATATASTTAATIQSKSTAQIVVGWAVSAAAAVASGATTALIWAMYAREAIIGAAKSVGSLLVVAGGWVTTAATATASAIVMAAAWVVGLGPVAWVIAGIAALIAVIVLVATKTTWFQTVWKVMTDALGAAWQWLWNSILAPIIRFVLGGFASITGGIANMLGVLSNIPGFDWAKTAADKMSGAADKARALADGIKDIPPHKTVTVTANYVIGQQVASMMNTINKRIANAGNNAAGTDYWRGGLTWVGERGRELLNLPRGSQIIPENKIRIPRVPAFGSLDSATPAARAAAVGQAPYGGPMVTVDATVVQGTPQDIGREITYALAGRF